MPVTNLQSSFVTPYDPRRRAAERRPSREPAPRPELPAAPPPPDPGFLAPVFRPDLSQLTTLVEPHTPAPTAEIDDALGQLVTAVREGDLGRARAALDALETEMLVERSAGHAEASRWLGVHERLVAATDRLLPAAPSVHAADDAYETLAHYLDTDGLTF